jgi:exodeoxyribonuclease-3
MKLVSWNVNGLRACYKKGFDSFVEEINPDILCIQETKMQEEQKTWEFPMYYEYWNNADKRGYSGTLIYTKVKPIHVFYGLEDGSYNDEGRIITLEFEEYFLVNVYTPNSKRDLSRIPYREKFEDDLRNYLISLKQSKGVILCGDLNVAHKEIDLSNPKNNMNNAGFTKEERSKFSQLLSSGFIDVFRYFYPDKIKYTWWSYMFNSRSRNIGWRIDYFVVSKNLIHKVKHVDLLNDYFGSDHCPIIMELE